MTLGGTIALAISTVFILTLPGRHLAQPSGQYDAVAVAAWKAPLERFYDSSTPKLRLVDGYCEPIVSDDIYGDGLRPAWFSFSFVLSVCILTILGPIGELTLCLNSVIVVLPSIAWMFGAIALAAAPCFAFRKAATHWRLLGIVLSLLLYTCLIAVATHMIDQYGQAWNW